MLLMVPREMDGHPTAGDGQQEAAARFRLLLIPRYHRVRESSSLDLL